MNKIFFAILFSTLFGNIFCQGKKNLPKNSNKIAFELNSYSGKIIRHNEKFLPEINQFSYGFELSVSYKTFGNKNWHRALNYPEIGLAYLQMHFGDYIFGSSYGLLPLAKFNIFRTKHFDFYARLGAGLSMFTKSYDPVTNPTNNVIGSKINAIIQYRMGFDIRISKEIDIVLAGSFTHFSNSSFQAPNLGINIPTLNIGINYKPSVFNEKYIITKNAKHSPDYKLFKKNEYSFVFGLGIKDKNIKGAKFPIYSASIQYARFIGFSNKLIFGTAYSFDQYEYDFIKIHEIHTDKNQTLQAMDWSLYGGYEILLGNVGFNFLAGVYLINNIQDAPIWAKPGMTYYLKEFGNGKHKPFIGVNIKTHYLVAQYVEIHTGIAF